MFIWIFVHLNKSSFNFARLIFRSRHASRSRRFCGSWLQSVSRLSALLAVMAALLAATIQPMRLKARSQFADAAKIEKMKTAVLTRNGGKLSRTSGSFQKHLGSASYFFFNVYQLFLVKIDFDAILPFRHFGLKKKRFRHSEIDCDQKKVSFVLNSTLWWKKFFFFNFQKTQKFLFFELWLFS